MGFLERRREKKREREEQATEAAADHIRTTMDEGRAGFLADGDAALRKLVEDVWTGAPTSAMQLLREYWQPSRGEATGKALYDEEFGRHWTGLDRPGRAEELEGLIRFDNFLADRDTEDARVVVITALVKEKVRLLAWAHDMTYETDYYERLLRDPLQFGVHEPARSPSRE